jgi:O-antigen/teichoic acid export membrane protein
MRILKNSAVYLGSSLINKAIPFLLLPILTNYLSPQEYGLLSIFQILITFYNPIVGMAINTNIAKNYFNYGKEELGTLVGNIFLVLFASTSLIFAITFLGTLFQETIFSIPRGWVRAMPLLSFMFMINMVNLTILRMEERAILYGVYEIANTAVNMGATILLLVCYNYGWYSRAIGISVAYFLFFGIAIIHLSRSGYLLFRAEKQKVKEILSLSLPLIPHAVGSVVIAVSDRIFIEKMIDLKTVGIYSVGYMFGMVLMLFSDAFVKAWNPWFFKTLSLGATQKKKELVVKYTYLYLAGIVLLCLLVTLAGRFLLPYVVGKEFYEAEKYIFWIALGYVFFAVYQIFFPYLVHLGKTAFLAKSTVAAALINLVLNYFFIKAFGAIGAAYATIVAFFISGVLVFNYQQKHYEMPWNVFRKSNQEAGNEG